MNRTKQKPKITAAQLKAWRLSRQLSQTDAAKELKTPWRTYVGWERKESRIPGAVAAYVERDYELRQGR